MNIYLTEPGMILKKDGGKYIVEKENMKIKEIPQNLLEAVNVYSEATITSQCINNLILNNAYIFWFNASNLLNRYIENLETVKSENIYKQVEFLKEEGKRLELSKKIIKAKLSNAIIILKRFNRTRKDENILENINIIKKHIKQIDKQKTILKLYGIEGLGSKEYFKAISKIVGKNFMYKGREKRPAKDPMNSLLNFGYSILYSEIIAIIKQENLSPFYGFMHSIKNGHASLASDIMEEFRYQLVDSVILKILNTGLFKIENFETNHETGAVYLGKELRKQYIFKIIEKINSIHKYNGKEESYRDTIRNQIKSYKNIINKKDISVYEPLRLK